MSIFIINSYITFPDLPPDQIANAEAMSFNGTDQYINIPNSTDFNLGTAFTISGWFNFSSNKYQGLVSFDATSGGSPRGWFLFQISSSNDIRLFDGTTVFTLKTSYTTTNQWDHFAVTYNGTYLVFYINGNQESIQAVSVDLQTNGNDGQIGNNQFSAGRFFDGKMDEVAIFNTALSGPKIQQIYDATAVVGGVPQTANLFTGGLSSSLVYWNRMGDS